jgi:Protein kinase domain
MPTIYAATHHSQAELAPIRCGRGPRMPRDDSLPTSSGESDVTRDSDDSLLRKIAAVPEFCVEDVIRRARLAPGDVVSDRFVVERRAGGGGMGIVYRAVDNRTGELIALKVMSRPGRHDERFSQEARVLARLKHPAIVRYVDHGTTSEGMLYLAMEWLDGEDLARHLWRSRLTVVESVEIARGVADALSAAHARGLVHRDVKPSNVMLLGGNAKIKLMDFGIAAIRLSGTSSAVWPQTQSGVVLGTVGYMSPEQAVADRELDSRADVFALGCVLFECLTGEPAFSGEHAAAVLARVQRDDAPRVRTSTPYVPPELDDLVARMLARNRAKRPANGGAVFRELGELSRAVGGLPMCKQRPMPGPPKGRPRPVGVVLALAPDESTQGDEARRDGGEPRGAASRTILVALGDPREPDAPSAREATNKEDEASGWPSKGQAASDEPVRADLTRGPPTARAADRAAPTDSQGRLRTIAGSLVRRLFLCPLTDPEQVRRWRFLNIVLLLLSLLATVSGLSLLLLGVRWIGEVGLMTAALYVTLFVVNHRGAVTAAAYSLIWMAMGAVVIADLDATRDIVFAVFVPFLYTIPMTLAGALLDWRAVLAAMATAVGCEVWLYEAGISQLAEYRVNRPGEVHALTLLFAIVLVAVGGFIAVFNRQLSVERHRLREEREKSDTLLKQVVPELESVSNELRHQVRWEPLSRSRSCGLETFSNRATE